MGASTGRIGGLKAGRWLDWVLPGLLVGAAAAAWLVGTLPTECDPEAKPNFHMTAALAGDADTIAAWLQEAECADMALSAVGWALGLDTLLAIAYGAVLFIALSYWWPKAWRTTLLRERLSLVVWAPVAAAAFDIAENAVVMAGFADGSDGTLGVAGWAATVAPMFGWWKFIFVAVSLGALAATFAGMFGYRRMGQFPPAEPPPAAARSAARGQVRTPSHTGICLSGGGIRAASFALGGLQGLDEQQRFRPARFLSAVSGGAYTAVAWRIARATGDEADKVDPPVVGDTDGILAPEEPSDPPDTTLPARTLYEYICTHRRYLATGRGGAPMSVLTILVFLALNLGVLTVGLYLVAWPVGFLTALPFVAGGDNGLRYPGLGMAAPAGLFAGVAVAAFVVALVRAGRSHDRALMVTAAASAASAAAFVLLYAIPSALAAAALSGVGFRGWIEGDIVAPLTAVGVSGVLVRILLKPLGKAAPRLGGVLLLVVAVAVGGRLALDSATEYRWWSDWRSFVAAAVVFAVFYHVANLRSWSLHTLYLARLRSTFSTKQVVIGNDRSVTPRQWDEEQPWAAYQDGRRPELLICASAQRQDRTGTGIPAVSFVFSPRAVTMYDHRRRADGSLEVRRHATAAAEYAKLLPGKIEKELTKPSAAAAMSGAAVTSAMGRFDLGTTNALLAALNVRLGVWIPNPRYIEAQTGNLRPFKRTRLNYLLKEIFGIYDLREPFVYVTDGGHWENLGLVELLRQECATIFSVDASGDPPGSAATLREALILAEVECGVTVSIDQALERLVPDPYTRLAEDCVAVGVVRYHHSGEHSQHAGCPESLCPAGILAFAKAAVSRHAPDAVRAYALQDRRFPGYSTADQFLPAYEELRLPSEPGRHTPPPHRT